MTVGRAGVAGGSGHVRLTRRTSLTSVWPEALFVGWSRRLAGGEGQLLESG